MGRMRWVMWLWCAFVLWSSSNPGTIWNALTAFEKKEDCIAQGQENIRRVAAVMEKAWSLSVPPDGMSFLAFCTDPKTCQDQKSQLVFRCLPSGTPPIITAK